MPANLITLKAKFYASVEFFNRDDFDEETFAEYGLHNLVAMKKIDDVQSYYTGLKAVRQYHLTTGTDEKAWFNPGLAADFKVIGPLRLGFVSGKADWVDRTVPSPTPERRIAYSITYVFNDATDQWQAIHLWGTYI